MKTLTQLKKDLVKGHRLLLIQSRPSHPFLGRERYIHTIDSTGIYLNTDMELVRKGSFLKFPKASELTYEGDTFSIDSGYGEILTYKIIK